MTMSTTSTNTTTAVLHTPVSTLDPDLEFGEAALLGNRAASPVDEYVAHLDQVLVAVSQVSTAVQLLAACRYAPSAVIEAAVTDLADALRGLQVLGPAGGRRPLVEIEADLPDTSDPRIEALRTAIRRAARDIDVASQDLSLELRRLLADLRDVVSLGTGSSGTYDSLGRTTLGDHRRRHAVM
jgi:hypothetical protein